MTGIVPLGESAFNYTDYTPWRFLHYFQQIEHVLTLRPATVLEIGPGDHTVADFLSRKGVRVETYDRDAELHPTWLGDIREPLVCDRTYDVVLCSEVLEHMPYAEALDAARNVLTAVRPGGWLVISVPYTTVRLFPERADYGRIVSCEGRIHTGLPNRWWQRMRWPARTLVRLARGDFGRILELPNHRAIDPADVHVHHWDLGDPETTVRSVRRDLDGLAPVVEVTVRRNTNCVFFTLQRPAVA